MDGVDGDDRHGQVRTANSAREGPLGERPLAANAEHYVRLLARSMETLLAPLGYTEEGLLQAIQGRATRQERLLATR